MPDNEVRLERDGGVAELVLAAPQRANALDLHLGRQLEETSARLAASPSVRVVLIRAEGPHFCVGGDVHAFAAHGGDISAYVGQVAEVVHSAQRHLAGLAVPVISAAHGAIAGAGVGLAFSADLVVLAHSAKVRLAYTAIGLSPDNGASHLLPRLIGTRRALELALTNRTLTAHEALDWGLATAVVDDRALVDEARKLADALARMSPEALAATKRLVRTAGDTTQDAHLDAEASAITVLAATDTAQRAIAEFAKR
ncbi:enoyl-CoA hydratase/isomerase family protein [Amycolatopsis sp. NPDC051372]|uniref:enoyl-CoA hydratase/isomerase family protein n=1 Tax=Amycolatopsis sp. NPDC051372 TaxID=3155669 RepID=UPI003438D2C9